MNARIKCAHKRKFPNKFIQPKLGYTKDFQMDVLAKLRTWLIKKNEVWDHCTSVNSIREIWWRVCDIRKQPQKKRERAEQNLIYSLRIAYCVHLKPLKSFSFSNIRLLFFFLRFVLFNRLNLLPFHLTGWRLTRFVRCNLVVLHQIEEKKRAFGKIQWCLPFLQQTFTQAFSYEPRKSKKTPHINGCERGWSRI